MPRESYVKRIGAEASVQWNETEHFILQKIERTNFKRKILNERIYTKTQK